MNEKQKINILALADDKIIRNDRFKVLPKIKISGVDIQCVVMESEMPDFNEDDELNKDYVLVRVDYFSCNYRDKAIILKAALKMQNKLGASAVPIAFFGSDFVGTIVKKGFNVKNIEKNDRIIPDANYPYPPHKGVAPGVTTNEASKGWLKLHKAKVIKIPERLEDEIAAGFTIGAQTSESMIRKANIQKKDKILVLSGRSHTSLFITRKLIKEYKDITVLTTSDWTNDEIKFLSPAKVIKIPDTNLSWAQLDNIEKYDVVFDPYYDLHLTKAIEIMQFNGRYVTCGFKNQHNLFVQEQDKLNDHKVHNIITTAMIKNISIIGNCIGTTNDLKISIDRHDSNAPEIPIQKVYSVEEGNLFLNRTYDHTKKFGKIILKYK